MSYIVKRGTAYLSIDNPGFCSMGWGDCQSHAFRYQERNAALAAISRFTDPEVVKECRIVRLVPKRSVAPAPAPATAQDRVFLVVNLGEGNLGTVYTLPPEVAVLVRGGGKR